jgi:hypothetical protein
MRRRELCDRTDSTRLAELFLVGIVEGASAIKRQREALNIDAQEPNGLALASDQVIRGLNGGG